MLNGVGNERYSNQQLTKNPIATPVDRLLDMIVSTKTFSNTKWEKVLEFTQGILAPSFVVSENECILRYRKPKLTIKSLSDFITICYNNRKAGIPVSFDPLLDDLERKDEERQISIIFETNEASQSITLEMLNACLETEETSTLTRTRKTTVAKVFVTVSYNALVTANNIREVCSNGYFLKDKNPYLE